MTHRSPHTPPRGSCPTGFVRSPTTAPTAEERQATAYAIRRRGLHNSGDLLDYVRSRSDELRHGGCVCRERQAERIWSEFRVMKNRSPHLETSPEEIRRALEDDWQRGEGGSCDA